MTVQEGNSTSRCGAEHSGKVTVALVSKYAPEGIGGIQNHLDMLLRHVQTPACSYVFVTGSEGEGERSGRVGAYLRFVQRLRRCRSELAHFHGFDRLQLLTLMLFARRRIPLVVTPHNGVAGIVNELSAVRRLAKRWADGLLFPIADPATRARRRAQRGRARLLSRPVSPLRPLSWRCCPTRSGRIAGPPCCLRPRRRACWHLLGLIQRSTSRISLAPWHSFLPQSSATSPGPTAALPQRCRTRRGRWRGRSASTERSEVLRRSGSSRMQRSSSLPRRPRDCRPSPWRRSRAGYL